MTKFIVDPALLTTPDDAVYPGPVTEWVESLQAWAVEIQGSSFDWRHLLACTEQLFVIDRFPTSEKLRLLVGRVGADINVRKISTDINRFFLDKSKDLATTLRTECMVPEEGTVSVDPSEFLTRNVAPVRKSLTDTLLCLACDQFAGEEFASQARIVTMNLKATRDNIHVRAKIGLVAPEEVMRGAGTLDLDQHFPVVASPEDLGGMVSIFECLRGPEQMLELIRRRALRLSPEGVRPLTMGPALWDSLRRTGIDSSAVALCKLIDAAADVVAGREAESMFEIHHVRSSPSGNSKQVRRARDNAKGWRIVLTSRGAGWRLQYWYVPGAGTGSASIELVTVLQEQDEATM